MVDVPIPPDEIVDPPARWASPAFPWWNRDQCRTPMPWTGEPGAGFTTGRPWIRIGPDAARRNVAAQRGDPDSVLECYRRLLKARRRLPSLRRGGLRRLRTDSPDVLAWQRGEGTDAVVALVNFSTGERRVGWDATDLADGGAAWRPVVGTSPEPAVPAADGRILLRGLEGVLLGPANA